MIFAAVTAEEQGLLGRSNLGKHPPVPAGKIALDLNYDDVKPLGAAEEVEVSGAERTTFYPWVQATAKEFRLAIRPDARPEAGHFYRSDHFSLARVRHSFVLDQRRDEVQRSRRGLGNWRRTRNTPRSTTTSRAMNTIPRWISSAIRRWRGLDFALGWEAASFTKLIGWQKGDEFERRG